MPAKHDIRMNRGNSFTLDVELVDSEDAPLDLTGSSFLAIVHVPGNQANPVATLTETVTGANTRRFTLAGAATAGLGVGQYRWELQWTDSLDEPWDLLRGAASVSGSQQGTMVDSVTVAVSSGGVTAVTVALPGTQGPAGAQGPPNVSGTAHDDIRELVDTVSSALDVEEAARAAGDDDLASQIAATGTAITDEATAREDADALLVPLASGLVVVDAGSNLSVARPTAAAVLFRFDTGVDVGEEGANVVNGEVGDLYFVASA